MCSSNLMMIEHFSCFSQCGYVSSRSKVVCWLHKMHDIPYSDRNTYKISPISVGNTLAGTNPYDRFHSIRFNFSLFQVFWIVTLAKLLYHCFGCRFHSFPKWLRYPMARLGARQWQARVKMSHKPQVFIIHILWLHTFGFPTSSYPRKLSHCLLCNRIIGKSPLCKIRLANDRFVAIHTIKSHKFHRLLFVAYHFLVVSGYFNCYSCTHCIDASAGFISSKDNQTF